MKKLIVLLSAMLILVGCANKEASTSKNDVIFTIGKNSIKQDQIFHTMKASDKGATAIRLAQNILTSDVSDDDVKDALNEMLTRQKDDLKGEFLTEIQKLGFETEEDYVEKNLKPYVKLLHLLETTISEDYDRFAQEQIPRKVAVLEILSKENATKAKDLVDKGASLETVAKELDEDVKYAGEIKLDFLASSTLPNAVTRFLKETNEPATSEIIETGDSEKKYYIAELVDADLLAMKDEIIEAAMDTQDVSQRELARLYKQNGFKIFDQGIYNALKQTHAEYLAN